MKNAMQLKSAIKKVSMETHIPAQVVMQNYMFERLVERISLSKYKNNIVLKGGLLIASIVGLNSRATMDMDATIKNHPVNEESIQRMFEEIIHLELNDGIAFTFRHIDRIREKDEYDGYRVALTANFFPMQIPLKLDVTTGDKITPAAIEYHYPMMFEERTLSIFAYNLETIIAEKLETVISRGDQNTRPRDYYDIFILFHLKTDYINPIWLCEALNKTAEKRHSAELMTHYKEIMQQVQSSNIMQKHWENYQRDYEYAQKIAFSSLCETVIKIMNILYKK